MAPHQVQQDGRSLRSNMCTHPGMGRGLQAKCDFFSPLQLHIKLFFPHCMTFDCCPPHCIALNIHMQTALRVMLYLTTGSLRSHGRPLFYHTLPHFLDSNTLPAYLKFKFKSLGVFSRMLIILPVCNQFNMKPQDVCPM